MAYHKTVINSSLKVLLELLSLVKMVIQDLEFAEIFILSVSLF